MSNPFENRANGLAGPATDILPLTPSDSVDLTTVALALYIETGGVVSIKTEAGATRVVKVADFSILPVGVRRLNAMGTTATGVHAMLLV